MSWWQNHKKLLLGSGGGGLLLVFFVIILPHVIVPPKQIHSYLIFAGNVSRAIVLDSRAPTQTGKPSFPRLPHHLEFTSSNGPIEVYVLDFSDLEPQAQVTEMMDRTNELMAGQPPDRFVARGEGQAGQIALHSWPYGTAKYTVLIHSPQDSEVVLEVHYGP